jgi:hypothetical protein
VETALFFLAPQFLTANRIHFAENCSSRNGNTYFSDYKGRTKLVLLRDASAECTGAEVARWNVQPD